MSEQREFFYRISSRKFLFVHFLHESRLFIALLIPFGFIKYFSSFECLSNRHLSFPLYLRSFLRRRRRFSFVIETCPRCFAVSSAAGSRGPLVFRFRTKAGKTWKSVFVTVFFTNARQLGLQRRFTVPESIVNGKILIPSFIILAPPPSSFQNSRRRFPLSPQTPK